MPKIGLVTIGQSPRTDILPDMLMILGHQYDVVETGALDDYTTEEIKNLRMRARSYIITEYSKFNLEIILNKIFNE